MEIIWVFFCLQNDKDKENFSKLVQEIKKSKTGKSLGVFAKDNYPGEFCESWKGIMKSEKFENVDISSAIALLMATKEDSEIITVKKACLVTVDVFTKYLKDQIMEIIDSDKVGLYLILLIFKVFTDILHGWEKMCLISTVRSLHKITGVE